MQHLAIAGQLDNQVSSWIFLFNIALLGVAEIAELDNARPANQAPDQTDVLEHSRA